MAAEKPGTWEPLLTPDDQTDSPESDRPITVEAAVNLFLEEVESEKGRNLAKPNYGKYKTLLTRLKAYCSNTRFRRSKM